MPLPPRLPLTVPVLPGEHFPGWFERLADDLGVGPGHLIEEIGLNDTPSGVMANWGIGLSARQEERLAAATGMPPGTWAPTLLIAFDGVAADLDGYDPERPETTLRALSQGTWLVSPGDRRYCPECLASDRTWRLTWCTRFEFGCPDHGTVLLDRCHACGRGARAPHSKRSLSPVDPYRCVRCDASLADARADPLPAGAADAATAVRSALTGGPTAVFGEPCQPSEFFDSLRLLATVMSLLGAVGTSRRRADGTSPSASPAVIAAAPVMAEAWRLTTTPANQAENTAVVWLRGAYPDRSQARRTVRRHKPSPATDVLLRAIDRS